jgi:hypothetical protein
MKRALTALLFFVFFAVPAMAQWKEAIKSFFPQVSSPAAEQAGVTYQGTPFQAANSTSFYCRIIIGKKDVGVITAGEIVYDERRWHNQWQQYFPVAAICYRDAAMTDYVGSAGRILTLNEYSPAEWTIRSGDIRTPDGRMPAPAPTASASAASPTSRRIKLPRAWWASSVGVQIINNTPEDLKIFVNGRPVAVIGTGGVDYVRAELVGGYSRPLIITITAGAGCTYTEQVWVQRNYPLARQVIFGPEYCGWSRR